MGKSRQVRVPLEAFPLMDALQAQLHADTGLVVTRADAIKYALVLTAWYLSAASANGDPDPPRLGTMVAQIKVAKREAGQAPPVTA